MRATELFVVVTSLALLVLIGWVVIRYRASRRGKDDGVPPPT